MNFTPIAARSGLQAVIAASPLDYYIGEYLSYVQAHLSHRAYNFTEFLKDNKDLIGGKTAAYNTIKWYKTIKALNTRNVL